MREYRRALARRFSGVSFKQHYLADLAGGLVLAFAIPAVSRRWGPGKEGR